MVVLVVPVLAFVVAVASPAAAGNPKPTTPAKAQAAKAPAAKAPVAKRKAKPTRAAAKPKVIELFHINSKEKLRLRFLDDSGRPVRDVQRRCDRFLRSHHTKKQGKMHPRLMRLLF